MGRGGNGGLKRRDRMSQGVDRASQPQLLSLWRAASDTLWARMEVFAELPKKSKQPYGDHASHHFGRISKHLFLVASLPSSVKSRGSRSSSLAMAILTCRAPWSLSEIDTSESMMLGNKALYDRALSETSSLVLCNHPTREPPASVPILSRSQRLVGEITGSLIPV